MLHNNYENVYNFENSYEKFIQHHLQHYGYYNGRQRSFMRDLEGFETSYNFPVEEEDDEETNSNLNGNVLKLKKLDENQTRTTQLILSNLSNGKAIYRLRDPIQNDFSVNFDQPTRWPAEMQVLPEKIVHSRNLPKGREMFYVKHGAELKPMPNGEEYGGRLVYEYIPFSRPFFMRSKSHSTKKENQPPNVSVDLESANDHTLLFESRFESGNLQKVYQISPYEYELHLRTDLYTSKHIQWYYFRISNTRANVEYRFTIVNLYKSDSLYNEGLRPLLYSDKDAAQNLVGWRRCGSDICYYRNNCKYKTIKGKDKYHHSLTWTLRLPHDEDTVYLSHCYPYTYSDMMAYVKSVSSNNDLTRQRVCQVKLLTKSLADNSVPILSISNPPKDPQLERSKKIIVITARVHPGETNASWMMEGVLDFLLSNKPDADLLRDLFIFKVIPMLNPDGVVVGNYRCSLAGRDLNRNYRSQLKSSYPVIYRLRNHIQKLLEERDVMIYCDLHGHSRKQNIFAYGNNDQEDEREFLKERAFSFLMSKNASDKFNYKDCTFKMQKSKSGTSRIVFRNLGVPHSFTIEASFCGSTLAGTSKKSESTAPSPLPPLATNNNYHFNTNDLKRIGEAFGNSLLDFVDPDTTFLDEVMRDIKTNLANRYLRRLQQRGLGLHSISPDELNVAQLPDSDLDSSSDEEDGSDSSDSNGLPADIDFVRSQISTTKRTKPKKANQTLETPLIKDNETCMKSENGPNGRTRAHNSPIMKQHVHPKTKFLTPVTTSNGIGFGRNFPLNSRSPGVTGLRRAGVPGGAVLGETGLDRQLSLRRSRTSVPKTTKDSISPAFDITKTMLQEVETKKVLLRYSGNGVQDGIENNSRSLSTEDAQKISNNKKNSVSWKINNEQLDDPNKIIDLKRPDSGMSTNTFQILSFSPHADMDPRQKNLSAFYQNHGSTNKRIQSINAARGRGRPRNSTTTSETSNDFLTFNSIK